MLTSAQDVDYSTADNTPQHMHYSIVFELHLLTTTVASWLNQGCTILAKTDNVTF